MIDNHLNTIFIWRDTSMKSVMRSIFKKYSIFIVAILNLLMFIISCIVFYWSGYIRDQYNIMNDGEYFDTFYLFCIVIM